MSPNYEGLIEVTAETVDAHGFFCCMSKRASAGWEAKRDWLLERFPEGLRLYLLGGGKRGFIEFMPGESCWRPVSASGWTVIHCLWVVGSSKGRGEAAKLLAQCIEDARDAGSAGVAVVASTLNFLTAPSFYEHFGFRRVDRATPRYELMALPFDDAAQLPRFTRAAKRPRVESETGLLIQTTDQCPYNAQLVDGLCAQADRVDLPTEVVHLGSAAQVRETAVTPHGTFCVALDGEPAPSVFVPRDFEKVLRRRE